MKKEKLEKVPLDERKIMKKNRSLQSVPLSKLSAARAFLSAQSGSVLALSFAVRVECGVLASHLNNLGVVALLDADIYPEEDPTSMFYAKDSVKKAPVYLAQMCDTMRPRLGFAESSERDIKDVLQKLESGTSLSCQDVRRFCAGCEILAREMLDRAIPELATAVLSMAEDALHLIAKANPDLHLEMRREILRSAKITACDEKESSHSISDNWAHVPMRLAS